MDDWKTYDLDEEPTTTRLPRRVLDDEHDADDDAEAPITLRSPQSGIVVRPRESQVTFAS